MPQMSHGTPFFSHIQRWAYEPEKRDGMPKKRDRKPTLQTLLFPFLFPLFRRLSILITAATATTTLRIFWMAIPTR